MYWRCILALKGILAAPFLFHVKMRQQKDKSDQSESKLFSLQHSTLNASQQTFNCTHVPRIMGSGLAETISITLLLQCIHWLIAVKPLGALGSDWLLYQARMPLLPSFLYYYHLLWPYYDLHPASTFVQSRTDGFCPGRFTWGYI